MARTIDEILTTETPEVVTQAKEKAEQMRIEIHMNPPREMEPSLLTGSDCRLTTHLNSHRHQYTLTTVQK
ncbi:hypothetical protein [Aeromonas salmonicida]|uniref:hypothetical protein n=1 Tax=Aeromonas salmonicida TaxID=645 RepID=UPI003D1D573B